MNNVQLVSYGESTGKVSYQSDMTMVNGNQSSFASESDSLDLLTISEICLEFPVTIIGNILCLVIFHYERFGGDPMKRSIVNKFISAVCLTMAATTRVNLALYGEFPTNCDRLVQRQQWRPHEAQFARSFWA